MPDREKTIKAMEYHKSGKCIIDGTFCPYWEYKNCDEQLESDALAILKEQDNLIEAAYSKGFTDGQNNMLEAISEGM